MVNCFQHYIEENYFYASIFEIVGHDYYALDKKTCDLICKVFLEGYIVVGFILEKR
jgi:hypothetical protein